MASLTNKQLDFLSNEKLIRILRSVLEELDMVASYGAHRSTTYLAVSAVEGLFGELFSLLQVEVNTVPVGTWPVYKSGKNVGKPKKVADLHLSEKIDVLSEAHALPQEFPFRDLCHRLREYRNYMHPAAELG